MDGERDVGGIRCGEVLTLLADYLEGEVPAADRGRIEAHLAGCDWCARFGGRYAETVATLREAFSAPPPLDPAVAERLSARLAAALGTAPPASDPDSNSC